MNELFQTDVFKFFGSIDDKESKQSHRYSKNFADHILLILALTIYYPLLSFKQSDLMEHLTSANEKCVFLKAFKYHNN